MPDYGMGVSAKPKLHLSANGGEPANSGIHAARNEEGGGRSEK
jgi:hypothetical protein